MKLIKHIGAGIIVFGAYTLIILSIDRTFNDYFKNDFELIPIIIGFAITYWTLAIIYKRSEIWGPDVTGSLVKLGFKLIDERPLTFAEAFNYLDWSPRPTMLVNGVPIGMVGKKMANRMLKVIDEEGNKKLLCVAITKTLWNGNIEIEIIKKLEFD